MESRKNAGIIRLLITYVAILMLYFTALCIIVWLITAILGNSGFIYAANFEEKQAEKSALLLEEKGSFQKEILLEGVGFYYKNATGQIATNLNEKAQEKALQVLKGNRAPFSWFYRRIEFPDQTVCILVYHMGMDYTDAKLRDALPGFEISMLVLSFCLLASGWGLITFYFYRIFKKNLNPLKQAAGQLAAGNLDQEFTHTGIKEYEDILSAMELLKGELRKSLQRQWKMQQDLAAQINALAHDLKTPLTVIGGHAQLLEEEASGEEEKQCVDAIIRSVEQAQEYVQKLKSTVMMEENGMEEIQGRQFLENIRDTSEDICRLNGIKLSFESCELPVIRLLEKEAKRAVLNLVENAVTYARDGGRIRISCTYEKEMLCFCITDSGNGFTKEAIRHGKEMFYTENKSRTQYGHMGMGLFFAEEVAKMHQGSLILENTKDGHGRVLLRLNVKK